MVKAIFKQMQDNEKSVSYILRIEYIEIYNEELRDLLHPETTSKVTNGLSEVILIGVWTNICI